MAKDTSGALSGPHDNTGMIDYSKKSPEEWSKRMKKENKQGHELEQPIQKSKKPL